jgi:hypothetical protein
MLATGGLDGTLLLWELASGRVWHRFIGQQSRIQVVEHLNFNIGKSQICTG